MREPISLKEILAVLVKRGWGILITVVALAVALGAYQGKKQLDLSKLPENSPQQIETEYQANLAAAQAQKLELESALAEAELDLARQLEYIENSVVMKLDPYQVARSIQVLSIEIPVEDQQGDLTGQSEDRYARINSRVQNSYKTYWNVANLTEELKKYGITEIEEKYLREVVSVSVADGLITITAWGGTVQDTENLAKAVRDWFLSLRDFVAMNIFDNELIVLTGATKVEISENVLNHQTTHNESKEKYQAAVDGLKNDLANLPAVKKRAGYSVGEMLKAVIKWAILGAIAGGIVSCGWILVMFMFRTKVESSRQMEQVLDIPFLGSAAQQGNVWKRLADRMLNERTWSDPAQAESYLVEAIGAAADTKEQILVLTTLAEEKPEMALVEQAAAKVAAKVVCIVDAERNAKTVKAMQDCRCVVLAERVGVSEVPKMQSLLALAERMDAKVVGFVTV